VSMHGLEVEPVGLPSGLGARWNLELILMRTEAGSIDLMLPYATSLYERSTAVTLADGYVAMATSAAADPDGALAVPAPRWAP
jgi:hypothetical protein